MQYHYRPLGWPWVLADRYHIGDLMEVRGRRVLWIVPKQMKTVRDYVKELWTLVRDRSDNTAEFEFLEPIYLESNLLSESRSRLLETIERARPSIVHFQQVHTAWNDFSEFLEDFSKRNPHVLIVGSQYQFPVTNRVQKKSEGFMGTFRGWFGGKEVSSNNRTCLPSDLKYFDQLIVDTEMLNESREDIERNQTVVIPQFANFEPGAARAREPLNLRRSDLTPSKPYQVIVHGYVGADRGQDLAVRAVAKSRLNVKLTLVGGARRFEDHRYLDHCLELARELGIRDRVVVTGFIDRRYVRNLFQGADLVLAPFKENFGFSALSMAFSERSAILASDLAVMQNLESRQPGCIATFRQGDENDCARQMDELLLNVEARDNLRVGVDQYLKVNAPSSVAKRHIQVYERLIQKRA